MLEVTTVTLLSAALLTASSVPPASPSFIEEDTSAVLRDGAVIVSFVEAGLPPERPVAIRVAVDATTVSECVTDGSSPRVVFATSSSASATQVSTYTADAKGRVEGTHRLAAQPGGAQVSGLGCTMRTRTQFQVRVEDRTNGVAHDVVLVRPAD